MQDHESLEHEVRTLRQRVADLQHKLASLSSAPQVAERCNVPDISVEERERLLRNAERNGRIGTWVWNLDTDDVYWSDELFRILGYTPGVDRACVDAFYAAIHPEDRERVRAGSVRALETLITERTEFRIQWRDGSVHHAIMDASFVFDERGKPHRIVGTVIDASEVRALQEKLAQAEKMEALGRLAAGVAHDFNNLLMVVRGNLDLQNLPRTHELEQVYDALDSARELTTKLLTLGRRSPLRRRVVDLNELVQKTLGLVERLTREQFTLRIVVSNEPLWVDVDETLIEQAIVNLLLNARDVLRDGGEVEVSVAAQEHQGRPYVVLSVRDNGPGMDEATRTHIFEPFFTTKADSQNHGLGLAMVHGTMAQHGGSVVVESELGVGTAFHLRFPRLTVNEPLHSARLSSIPPPARVPCRVLVIEDQDTVGHTIMRLLEHLGHEVELAADSNAAIEAVTQRAFDVVLCDVMMPDMRGPALIEKLETAAPGRNHGVVFMTGNSGDLLQGRPDLAILPKPFTLKQLDDAIRRAHGRRKAAT